MTVKETAKKWNVSEATVRRYCSKKYIRGARKEKGKWVIPDGCERPYISRKKKFKSDVERSDYVLRAIGSGLWIDTSLLELPEADFLRFAEELKAGGYVTEFCTKYRLTNAGIDKLRELEKSHRQAIRDNISTVLPIVKIIPIKEAG